MKMIRFHLTVTIYNSFFQVKSSNWKMTSRDKINSVWFYDYDYFFEKLINEMDLNDINKFKLNIFNCFKQYLSCLKTTQIVNGSILEGYSIPSVEFNIPWDCIACCVPSRKIRDKYFEYDCLREKYYIKPSFINYLKS